MGLEALGVGTDVGGEISTYVKAKVIGPFGAAAQKGRKWWGDVRMNERTHKCKNEGSPLFRRTLSPSEPLLRTRKMEKQLCLKGLGMRKKINGRIRGKNKI